MDRGATVSGGMFEGLPRTPVEEDGQQYQAGSMGFDLAFVEALIEAYLSESYLTVPEWRRETEGRKVFRDEARGIGGLLDSRADVAGLNADSLLDAVISAITALDEEQLWDVGDHLLNPLVQALYERGKNDFHVDLSPLEDVPDFCVHGHPFAAYLAGTKERPLRAVYTASELCSFGERARHAELELLGYAVGLGESSHYVKFRVRDNVPEGAGMKASHCEFRINGLNSLDRWGWHNHYYVSDEEFLSSAGDVAFLAYIKGKGFTRQRNRIFVPDGAGGWRRV